MSIDKILMRFGEVPKARKNNKVYATEYYCELHLKEYNELIQATEFASTKENTPKMPYCKECADYIKTKSMMM